MKAFATILIFFISLLNPSKMQSKKEIIAAKNSYQQEQALLNESYLQYKSLSELLAQLSPEDPEYQSFKAALTKAKKVLGPYKKQLAKEKTVLETIIASFLGAQQEDIPKEQYRKVLALFFVDLQQGVSSRLGKKPALKTGVGLIKLRSDLVLFFNQVPGPLSKQLNKEVKAIPIDTNVEDFLAAFLAILEKYSQEDQIKANWFNTFSIKEENLLKKISYQQLESILDQALAKDDFLTEEELEEKKKREIEEKKEADSTYREELARFNEVLRYCNSNILNKLHVIESSEETTALAKGVEYYISAKELIEFLGKGNTGHPLVRAELIKQLAAQLDSSKQYSIRELVVKIENSLELSTAFSTHLFLQEFYDFQKQEWVQGAPPAGKELYPPDWLSSCFDPRLRKSQPSREVAIIQLKEKIEAWFEKLQPSIKDPNIRNYCLNKKRWKASLSYLFSASTATGLKMPLLEDYFLAKIDQIDPKEDHLHMKDFATEVWDDFLGDKDFQRLDPFHNLLAEEIKQLADSAVVLLSPAKEWEKAIRASRCQGPKPLLLEPIDAVYNLAQMPITFSLQGEKELTHFDKVTIGFPLKYEYGIAPGVGNSLRQVAFLSFDESKSPIIVGGANIANMKIHSLTSDAVRCQRNGNSMDSYWVFSVRAEINLFSILGIDTTALSTLDEDEIPFYLLEEIRKYFGSSVSIGPISFDINNPEIKIDYLAKMEVKLSSSPKGIESLLLQNHLRGPIKFNPIPNYGLKVDDEHKANLFWEQTPKVKK
ncbi:hypothetical protein SapgrDRAFT_0404 [Saprospira grandis DSM 2844]|uniref:Uncharacterized protein n=1 Tax=Saprospira grandis DSM 2844 TaxID=694433 RepID=J1I0I4_9BACT|nr:hypothetical protein [Saprospira grandis]EJF52150.1 hypothetical protein SapgrDRAFT_0404 [Saprospira grandis DSM 2844]